MSTAQGRLNAGGHAILNPDGQLVLCNPAAPCTCPPWASMSCAYAIDVDQLDLSGCTIADALFPHLRVVWDGVLYRRCQPCEWRRFHADDDPQLMLPDNKAFHEAALYLHDETPPCSWMLIIWSRTSPGGGSVAIWVGEKATGNTPAGVYTKISGCAGPETLTVAAVAGCCAARITLESFNRTCNSSNHLSALGGEGYLRIHAEAGCNWEITASQSWLTFPDDGGGQTVSGTGETVVRFQVSATGSDSNRTVSFSATDNSDIDLCAFQLTQLGLCSSANVGCWDESYVISPAQPDISDSICFIEAKDFDLPEHDGQVNRIAAGQYERRDVRHSDGWVLWDRLYQSSCGCQLERWAFRSNGIGTLVWLGSKANTDTPAGTYTKTFGCDANNSYTVS